MLWAAALTTSSCSDSQASAATGNENRGDDFLDKAKAQKDYILNQNVDRQFSDSVKEESQQIK